MAKRGKRRSHGGDSGDGGEVFGPFPYVLSDNHQRSHPSTIRGNKKKMMRKTKMSTILIASDTNRNTRGKKHGGAGRYAYLKK